MKILEYNWANTTGVKPSTMSRLMLEGNNSGKSSSAVSLLSAEAEQALLKVGINRNHMNDVYGFTIETRTAHEDNRETFSRTSIGTEWSEETVTRAIQTATRG